MGQELAISMKQPITQFNVFHLSSSQPLRHLSPLQWLHQSIFCLYPQGSFCNNNLLTIEGDKTWIHLDHQAT